MWYNLQKYNVGCEFMNEKIIKLYKRKIAIINISFFLIITFMYFISNRFKPTQVNIVFILAFLFIFIVTNIAKVDGLIYLFPSMKELDKLERDPWKEEVKIKSKTSLIFILIFLSKLPKKDNIDFFMDLKVYLILLPIIFIIANIYLREEYKSIFSYNKNK